MIVTTKQLFQAAYGKYAIGAYNINNLEQTMGLFRGNMDSQAPFIIQISKGARSFTHKTMLEGLIRAADQVFPDAIFAVHLDHGDEATCYDCIQSGFYSSVMKILPPPSGLLMQHMPKASLSKPNLVSWAVWKSMSRWMKPTRS
jgi:fructose-bisphosphate aldolase class II